MKKKLMFPAATLQAVILFGVPAFEALAQTPANEPSIAACTASGLSEEQCQQCFSAGMTIEECLAQQAQLQPSMLEDAEEGAAPGGVVTEAPSAPSPSMGY
jgi:hypothetical protein